jgi:serine/threonine-protein kinase
VALILAGAVAGLLVFHLIVMPRFVRHGEEALVPDLRRIPSGEVDARLRAAGLQRGTTTRATDETVPMGQATRQSPPPGSRVKRGRAVDIVISLGAETQRVPELEGEGLVHVRFLLEQNGLREGRRRTVRTRERPAEKIVATNPRPGTPVRGRATVDLLVSAGTLPERFLMPDLRGTPVEAAVARLEAGGVNVEGGGSGRGAGLVRSQSPAPGTMIEAGDRVELEAGR